MKITQYCMKCGGQMQLDFGRRFKKGCCPRCKLKFRYKEAEYGALVYDYKEADIKDLYVAGANGQPDSRLIDIAKRNTEVSKRGAI